MSRDITSQMSDAIEAPVVRPFFALWIDLPDPVAVWTGTGTINFAGIDWIGAGGVGSLDTIGEETDGSATGVRATLLDIPSEFRDDIADQAQRGAAMQLWFGALNEDLQTITAVKRVWRGRVDTYEVVDSGNSIAVTVAGESRARDQNRPAIKRFTDEYQQRQYPGDRFFEYLPQMAEVSILWARGDQAGMSTAAPMSSGGFIGAMTRYVNT
ncbi:hypothetical protein [Sphingomonas montanisoli]|uniref:hypothetical protein n=1 Tax=Sphingomonas montanisoli TaxID=2606412 RepID=UPI0015E169A8|nr:hypothetical protein [Sphingomonas montanisoli]